MTFRCLDDVSLCLSKQCPQFVVFSFIHLLTVKHREIGPHLRARVGPSTLTKSLLQHLSSLYSVTENKMSGCTKRGADQSFKMLYKNSKIARPEKK